MPLRTPAALRHDWARQGALYLALSVCIVGAYTLVVTGLSLVIQTAIPISSPMWIGGLVLVLAMLLNPLRRRLQDLLDRTFFRGGRAQAATLNKLTEDLARAGDLTYGQPLAQGDDSTDLVTGPDPRLCV